MLAKIYQPSKNAMQSGAARSKQWVLEFAPSSAPSADRLMGWTSSSDTDGQVRLYFATQDEAVAFARKLGMPHQVSEPAQRKRILKAYGDNFAYTRREPWSH